MTDRQIGVEAAIGLSTRYLGVVLEDRSLSVIEADTGPLYALTPSVEWRTGSFIYLGLEVALASVRDLAASDGRRTVVAPGARIRLTFDVLDDLQLDAVASAGIARWGGEGDSSLYGFNRRIAFGGAWQAWPDLWTVLWLGSQVIEAGAAQKGPASYDYRTTQPIGVSSLMVTVGVRTAM